MKAQITFFPLGNADSTLIQITETNKTILWDFADVKSDEPHDKRCDLPKELDKRVKNDYDVVALTHNDRDHNKGMSKYFFLEHSSKYQGLGRKKIQDLWVPAAILLDTESLNDDDKIIRSEAIYRLKEGRGVKIFSKPAKLKVWLLQQGIRFESVKHLIVDAGTIVPGWVKEREGVEFFVHAPFAGHVDDYTTVDRNESAIIVQASFNNTETTKLILGADAKASTWEDIVTMTRYRRNDDKLAWDIFHISHHCSYTALNEDEKGYEKTEPVTRVKWLLENQGKQGCLIVSPSKVIEFVETNLPPHFQAYNYYKKDVVAQKLGSIIVTMEHPTQNHPVPLTVQLDDAGHRIIRNDDSEAKREAARRIASASIVTGNYGGYVR